MIAKVLSRAAGKRLNMVCARRNVSFALPTLPTTRGHGRGGELLSGNVGGTGMAAAAVAMAVSGFVLSEGGLAGAGAGAVKDNKAVTAVDTSDSNSVTVTNAAAILSSFDCTQQQQDQPTTWDRNHVSLDLLFLVVTAAVFRSCLNSRDCNMNSHHSYHSHHSSNSTER